MTPADFRALLHVSGLSNREAADALTIDDRLVRRLKSGAELADAATAIRLIELAAETLAGQMLRSLSLAAGGRVDYARLRVAGSAIHVDGLGDMAGPVRAQVLRILEHNGLTIEAV